MISSKNYYSLFLDFIENYSIFRFKYIDDRTPLMSKLAEEMEIHNQFFYVADMINMQVLYATKRSLDMIGVWPTEVSPYFFMEATHPDDRQRLNLGRATLIKKAQDFYIAKKGTLLISTNFRIRNASGEYSNILVQAYLYYSSAPIETVYFFKLHTNIDKFEMQKRCFHYYFGNDMSKFRYPDLELLSLCHEFTPREFEVISLIYEGMNTIEIADKLFISVHTVETHRRNILAKTKKSNTKLLILELKEIGLL